MVRAKELKLQALKEEKDRLNLAKQSEKDEDESDCLRPRRLSYTLTSPIFESDMLPRISADSSESDKDTVVDGPASMQSIQSITSDFDGNLSNKSEKDLRNEIDKRSTTPASSIYEEFIEPQVNTHLRDLIEKQKQEYLVAMETLKNKFTNEQEDLMVALQSNMLITSTPLNSSMAESVRTEDEDFTAFKTALQSQSLSLEEKTIVNDEDAKVSHKRINCWFGIFFSFRKLSDESLNSHQRLRPWFPCQTTLENNLRSGAHEEYSRDPPTCTQP